VKIFNPDNYYEDVGGLDIRLRCPLVTTPDVNDDRSTLTPKVEKLFHICERAHSNIATRVNEEHSYDVDGKGLYKIVAGSGLPSISGRILARGSGRFSTTFSTSSAMLLRMKV
jgi:hypothetical protein